MNDKFGDGAGAGSNFDYLAYLGFLQGAEQIGPIVAVNDGVAYLPGMRSIAQVNEAFGSDRPAAVFDHAGKDREVDTQIGYREGCRGGDTRQRVGVEALGKIGKGESNWGVALPEKKGGESKAHQRGKQEIPGEIRPEDGGGHGKEGKGQRKLIPGRR